MAEKGRAPNSSARPSAGRDDEGHHRAGEDADDIGRGSRPGGELGVDRLAGEPVDVRVNGRLFARGEVVAAAERYGVRLTEIIDASVNPDDASAAERDGDG